MKPDWIAVDWGTSHLRVFAMSGGQVVAEASSDRGMGTLVRDQFEGALLDLIAPWLTGPIPVVACGMVGSRQGWHEAPYRSVPCTPLDPLSLVRVPTLDPRLHLSIVPGLKQPGPADVMRGEETQIAGALALMPGFDGVLCLPGTHSKWVHVSANEVVSFQTAMTGELFALLSRHSVLRHGMGGEGWDDAAFDTALSDALSRPERLGTRLFALRAEGLLNNLSQSQARARLSGLLIGVELAATRAYWLGQPVAIVGADRLADLYARALTAQGASPRLLSVRDCTLSGLSLARTHQGAAA
ncbi:MAG: 2-dehydro-3-deoxygalactonokinase [Gemmobacter sp.]